MISVVSTSLHPESKSRLLVRRTAEYFTAHGVEHRIVDLREFALPLCDGADAYNHPAVNELRAILDQSDGVILGTPVYNYSVSSGAKNLIELVGGAFTDKAVGIVAAAGGPRGYMAPLVLMNSVMLDFRSVVIPKYVYATPGDFDANGAPGTEIGARLEELAGTVFGVASALRGLREERRAA